ncbi:MAG TPA: class I SAM-dependent methyltransferase [Azospirillaceae bacterium]|nr:class I SAM-dependent methyltransferase [Azospirillaceae bacterium]
MDCPLCAAPDCRPFAEVRGRSYRRCGTCLLTFLDPAQLPTEAEERAEYALHRNDPADPGYRRFLSRLVEPLAARLPPGAEGLDFGCGPGPALSAMMAERSFPVRDWDPLFRPDPAALGRRYGFVACTEVVEHFHRPAEGFALLDRLLEPGGWLGVMTSLLRDDAAFAGWSYIRERSHVSFYRPETMAWLAARFGWRAEMVEGNVALFRKPG